MRMRRKLTFGLIGLCGLIAAPVAFVSLSSIIRIGPLQPGGDQQSFLASLISGALSSTAQQVQIGGVDGALSSDATIHDIVISDRDGPWLKLDRARLVWRRSALLLRRLEVDKLEIGHLEIIRRPLPSETPKPVEDVSKDSTQSVLPDLPVKVRIQEFSLANLDLGETILGAAMRAAATGNTELGSPSEGLRFNLDGKRLDSQGTLSAHFAYVPDTNALMLRVALDEPEGGLMSKIGHLPGEPPVIFHITGDGTADVFVAKLDFKAGPTIDATGTLNLDHHDAGRDLNLTTSGHLGPLLPPLAASIFEGETKLTSKAFIADAGDVRLQELSLLSHLARLDVHGAYHADKTLDFAASVNALPDDGETSHAGNATIKKLAFESLVQGSVTAPKITAKVSVADAHLPDVSLDRLDGIFTAAPDGDVTNEKTKVALDARVDAKGFHPADDALAQAIGSQASFQLQGVMDTKGQAHFNVIEAKTPTVGITYKGDIGPHEMKGELTGAAEDLSQFAAITGVDLSGEASLKASLNGELQKAMHLDFEAGLAQFKTRIAAVDGLCGASPSLKGRIFTEQGEVTIDTLSFKAAHVFAEAQGKASSKTADIKSELRLPDLSKADARLAGIGHITTQISGSLEKPHVAINAALDKASAMARPIPHLALDAIIDDPAGALKADVNLDGTLDKNTARGRLQIAKQSDANAFSLDKLDVGIGSLTLQGQGALDETGFARGQLSLKAPDLDILSPLALMKLGGSLAFDAQASEENGNQALAINGEGKGLVAGNNTLHQVRIALTGHDLYRKPSLDGTASIDKASLAGQALSNISFLSKSDGHQSLLKLSGDGAGFALSADAALVAENAARLTLSHFSVQRNGTRIALSKPADFIKTDDGVDIRHFMLGLNGGTLAVDGSARARLALSIDAHAIPLAVSAMVKPDLKLGGTLEAHAKIEGTAQSPAGTYSIAVNRFTAPQMASANLPPLDFEAKGTLEGRKTKLNAKATINRFGAVSITGTVPFDPSGMMEITTQGKIDATIANAMLGPSGRTLGGMVSIDAKIHGTMLSPRVAGNISFSNGSFFDTLLGTRIDNINARLVGDTSTIKLEQLSASTPNKGTLSASGQIKVDPAGGFPGSVSLRGHDAQLASSSLMTATADLAIDVSGALARTPHIGGRVDITHMDVGIPDRLPSSLKPIDGITHLNAKGAAAERVAQLEKKEKAAAGTKGRPALFNGTLDMTVSAPNRIFLRGRGVDAELGGTLHVTGTTNEPRPNGGFEMRRGKLAALGKTLTFTKGKLAFSGDFVPELDFNAELKATSVTAQIAVTGPASLPVFTFSSSPELPQDEILSRVLFDKSSGSLSGFQALQLAQAAAQFSSGGDGAFEKLRKSLGVDSLDVGTNSKGGPSVGMSRAISDRVSVGVKTGATADQTGVSADVDITRHLRVQSDVRSNGTTSVGIGSEVEY